MCTFSDGDVQGGKEETVGVASTDRACVSLVMSKQPTAKGATWAPDGGQCYAEFGDHIVRSSKYKTCLFKAGKMFSMILRLISQQGPLSETKGWKIISKALLALRMMRRKSFFLKLLIWLDYDLACFSIIRLSVDMNDI